MNRAKLAVAVSMGSAIVLSSGCASFNNTMSERGGVIIGGIVGAAAGALACDGDPGCIAVGLVGGMVLGNLYDKRQEELRKVAQEKGIALETKSVKTFNSSKDNGFELSINEGGMFESDSALLKTSARMDLMSVATIYRDKPQKILVIGHTDASGSDAYNQTLSEQRARTVAELFHEIGVPSDQIYFQGAGESQPVATNDTSGGRSTNRRVEIIEIDSEESLAAYNLQRQKDKRFLAHSNKTASEKKTIRERVQKSPAPVQVPEVVDVEPVDEPMATPSFQAMVDFGGQPASADFTQIQKAAGNTDSSSNGISFSVFSEAVASPGNDLSPCYLDSPRVTGDIKNLGSGEKLEVSELDMADYWPGLNGNVWLDTVNGHMIAFDELRIKRESGKPEGRPIVRIYENVKQDKTADYVAEPHIEAYPGEKGLLMRTYFAEGQPVECMDVVMPNNGGKTVKVGMFYYGEGEGLYEQEIALKRLH
ncbi:OmpA family protein [Marinobacter sp. F3R08]|uniref:OmpA family protein n=1 Tax=Marinobacter sp. F3R08 TaxID=2841559 RepID=UPI001C0A5E8E|nr:OmpA family protein [Marinobacter sp. F3R08]MBU2952207.1 OmpA family protein [Marinobacter sp. F3R08]